MRLGFVKVKGRCLYTGCTADEVWCYDEGKTYIQLCAHHLKLYMDYLKEGL